MSTPSEIMKQVELAIAEPYAWPGGYPKYIIMSDGEALSIDAAREQLESIRESTLERRNDGWRVVDVDINWEDPALYCAHTGQRIESAYTEDEANQ